MFWLFSSQALGSFGSFVDPVLILMADTSKGNFRRAATHKQNLAEIYELEIGDQKKAIESYELAANWFENDNAEACVYSIQNGGQG